MDHHNDAWCLKNVFIFGSLFIIVFLLFFFFFDFVYFFLGETQGR